MKPGGSTANRRTILLVQPPFVQLNGPYPSIYYLGSFLEKNGYEVIIRDHSIDLFLRIFSRRGLEKIFEDIRIMYGTQRNSDIRGNSKKPAAVTRKTQRDSEKRDYINRFLGEKNLWLSCIDRLIAYLQGHNREWGHFLALANSSLPGGPRTDAFIAKNGGQILPDQGSLLATAMLSDLADLITAALDSGFGLIKYCARINESPANNSDEIRKAMSGYIMETFYRPFLEDEWETLSVKTDPGDGFLLGLTIPFPGCLTSALVCADSAKNRFGKKMITAAGGGYVNTELRFADGAGILAVFDHIVLDRGYAELVSILENRKIGDTEKISINDKAAKTIFPDYTGVDFTKYIYPVDDENPMHRLWSDGHWLKAYLAHGCYWHSCSFCDTGLDYIKSYLPVDPEALFWHLREQSAKTGCCGIHFADEAAPVPSLLKFAELNRRADLPFVFWGNIRLEKTLTAENAFALAEGGLIGISTGIEIASENGLRRINKGLTLEDMVYACAALKEAGILVHAYLIYGYWDQDEQEIINSAEIVRQLFSCGLVDSAFWHKFSLTCHSGLYADKLRGLHPELTVEPPPGAFSINDLSFRGEEKYDKYSEPLDYLLSAWLDGYGLDSDDYSMIEAFPFSVKPPDVPPDHIRKMIGGFTDKRGRE